MERDYTVSSLLHAAESDAGITVNFEDQPVNRRAAEREKTERLVVRGFWWARAILPLLFVVLRLLSIVTIFIEHNKHKIVTERTSAFIFLAIFVVVSCLIYIAQAVVYCLRIVQLILPQWPEGEQTWKRLVRFWQSRKPDQLMTLVADILFVTINFLNILLLLRDNCFRVGARSSPSLMDHIVTKGQKLVVVPSLVLLVKAFSETVTTCYDNNQNKFWNDVVKDLSSVVMIPLQFTISAVMFAVWFDGLCLFAFFSFTCPNVMFTISVSSHVRYTLNSNVLFPDPKLGLRVRTKVVDIRHLSFLANPGYIDSRKRCEERNTSLIEHDSADQRYCSFDAYTYVASDTQYLGTSNGILLEWPCNVTAKLRHMREMVTCLYRMKIILNDRYEFVFNYDYVYKLPESVTEEDATNEWYKRSKYKSFSSFINTGGTEENFQLFRKLFNQVDKRLASYTPVWPSSNTLELLASEPHVLHIECNRTCFCYRCIGTDEEIRSQPFCMRICPDVSVFCYRNYSKNDFCQPQNKDGCISLWKPIGMVSHEYNVSKREIATFQSPPVVTVLLDSGNVSATLDPLLTLQAPGAQQQMDNCVCLKVVLAVVGLIDAVVIIALVVSKSKRNSRNAVNTTTANNGNYPAQSSVQYRPDRTQLSNSTYSELQ